MLYPWVQLLKLEGIAPFGPHLAPDHAQSMRANTFTPVPHVLFVVESSRPERGWTRFVLRDPTGTVPAGTRDSDVAGQLVVGAAVKLTNVRLVPDSAFCGRMGIVIAWENMGRVVAPKPKPGKPHTSNIATFKETTPFSIYASLEGVKKDEVVADITYRQFRAEWTRRHPSPTSPPPPPRPLPTHTTATISSGDESFSSPSKEVLQQQIVAGTVDPLHHLVEEEEQEEEEDAGESDLSQPSDLPSSQPSEGDSPAGRRRTSAKRKYLKRVESDPTLPDSQPSPPSPRASPRDEESEAAKQDDVEGSDGDKERKANTNAEAATTAKEGKTKEKAKTKAKAKAKAKSEAEDEPVKRKRGRPKKEAVVETEEERIKKHRKSEEYKKQFVELFKKHAKPKVIMTPVVPLDEQARQLLDRCEWQQSQRLSQHRSQRAKSQRVGESESESESEDQAEADSEEDPTPKINQLEAVLTLCKQLCEKELVVVSLFDGIAGALRALKLLGIRVKAYYVVEKDPLAMDVVRANFPPDEHPYIHFLGCVEKITTADLEAIGPVDLVIGGSPCNDLSILGNKKGLDYAEGSSYRFYDFLRILRDLRRLCNSDSHTVFFLLENVASMSRKDKAKISDCMGVEPVRVDSKDISNVHRNRYYWHNIPRNINALPKATTFQEVLSQDGEALVLVGGCITTHNATMKYLRKSLKELRARPQDLKRYNTIKIKGQDQCRSLKPTEMERILGFLTKDSNEREYTKEGRDTNGRVYELTVPERNKLLGQSFDTRVIAHLLTPLLKLCAGEEQLESRILQIRRQVTLSQMHFVQPRPRPGAAAATDKGKDKTKTMKTMKTTMLMKRKKTMTTMTMTSH